MTTNSSPIGRAIFAALNSGRFALPLSHGVALQVIAIVHGFKTWNALIATGIPTDIHKAQAIELRSASKGMSLPLTEEQAEGIARAVKNAKPIPKGPGSKQAASNQGSTPLERFRNLATRDPDFGLAPREIYTIGRFTIPRVDVVKMPDGRMVKHPQAFMVMDLASKALVGFAIIRSTKTHATLEDLRDAINDTIGKVGRPTKGWLLSYSVWWSLEDMITCGVDGIDQRGEDLRKEGVTFDRMPLDERLVFQRWLGDAGMQCSFTEYWCYGGDKITAEFAEQEFPVKTKVRLERVPGSYEFNHFWENNAPALWHWVAGPRPPFPDGYRRPNTNYGIGFASLFAPDSPAGAETVEERRRRYYFLLQHQLSKYCGPTILVSRKTASALAAKPMEKSNPMVPGLFPIPAALFVFEQGALQFEQGCLETLQFGMARAGELLEIPIRMLPSADMASGFRRPINIPMDLLVTSAAYRLKGSMHHWDTREVCQEMIFGMHARTVGDYLTIESISHSEQGHVQPHLPPTDTPLPQTKLLLLNLVEHLTKNPDLQRTSHLPAII